MVSASASVSSGVSSSTASSSSFLLPLLGCRRFASLTPSVFLSFFLYTPSLFLSIFPGKPSNFPGSEPSLRLVWAQNQPNRQNTGYFAGIPGNPRVYLENTLRPPGYRADFLNFASDFAPDQLSDSGKLASFQNGAPNTLCFPWKFPETQSAGDPLFSFLFSGKLCREPNPPLTHDA